MRTRMILLAALLVPLVAVLLGSGGDDEPVLFADARMIIEFNSTDEDIGIQVFLDGDPWRKVKMTKPGGQKILEIETKSSLKQLGLTELFFESNEPEIVDLPIEEFLDLFPAGNYKFNGKTIEGDTIKGTAVFTHAIPDGPVLLTPAEDEVVDPDAALVISWEGVADPPGSEIVGYELIVESESGIINVLDVKVPASVTSFTVPPEFLEADTEYDFEVLAIEAGGNQTITERSFITSS